MKPYFPTKELERENDKLIAIAMNLTDDISDKEFLDKYASEEFKDFIRRSEKRMEMLRDRGVVEN